MFDPGNFVPGIGPSPDKMLQGRLFAYGDAHRYRLGINHTQLPVNAPHATEVLNYGRDGLMAGHGNGGRAKNYEPNSFDGPVETGEPYAAPLAAGRRDGHVRRSTHAQTDDFAQAGDLYRLQPADAQARLVDNIAGVGGGDARARRRRNRRTEHRPLPGGGPEFGERVAQGVKERQG